MLIVALGFNITKPTETGNGQFTVRRPSARAGISPRLTLVSDKWDMASNPIKKLLSEAFWSAVKSDDVQAAAELKKNPERARRPQNCISVWMPAHSPRAWLSLRFLCRT